MQRTYGCVIEEEEATGLILEIGDRRVGVIRLGSNREESGENVKKP